MSKSVLLPVFTIATAVSCLSPAHAQQVVNAGKNKAIQVTVNHGLSDAQLKKLAGKLYWDKEVKKILTPSLQKLLGSAWKDFDFSFNKTTPLVYKDGTLYGSGWFGLNMAAIEFQASGSVVAALRTEEGCTDFGPVNPGYLCDDLR